MKFKYAIHHTGNLSWEDAAVDFDEMLADGWQLSGLVHNMPGSYALKKQISEEVEA